MIFGEDVAGEARVSAHDEGQPVLYSVPGRTVLAVVPPIWRLIDSCNVLSVL